MSEIAQQQPVQFLVTLVADPIGCADSVNDSANVTPDEVAQILANTLAAMPHFADYELHRVSHADLNDPSGRALGYHAVDVLEANIVAR